MWLTHLRGTLPHVRPGPNFYALIIGFLVFGWLLRGAEPFSGTPWMFVFVVWGWVLSLVLHEFGHAFVAFAAGDYSVREKGYLTLDVTHYVHPVMSILLPILILVAGGIALPGGAVWVQPTAMRSRGWRTAVSLAGPGMNLLFAVILLVPVRLEWVGADNLNLTAGIVLIAWFQIVAIVLNMLPIPGLDGFGALEPWLSASALQRADKFRPYSFVLLIAILIGVPDAANVLFGVADRFTDAQGVPGEVWASFGLSQFEFWNW